MEIKKEALSAQVYKALKEMIADHRFSPGSRINVEELAKEFGVSRTPIWEAVRRLEQEGLLKKHSESRRLHGQDDDVHGPEAVRSARGPRRIGRKARRPEILTTGSSKKWKTVWRKSAS